jgi:multidrug resistance efflux pump
MVQLQNVRLSQTQVRAPDAGVISARQAKVGSVVGAGTELFRLIRQGRIEWRAEVTAAEIGRIQLGAPAKFLLDIKVLRLMVLWPRFSNL